MTSNLTSGPAPRLPAAFAELEPYVSKWALETHAQRGSTRAKSSIEELREFYSAILPRATDALDALRGKPLEDLDEQHTVLLKLMLSLAEVAVGVECLGEPTVPYGYERERLLAVPVPNMTPPFWISQPAAPAPAGASS